MLRHKPILVVFGLLLLGLALAAASISRRSDGKPPALRDEIASSDVPVDGGRKAILDVAKGQIPNDIGSDRPDNVQMTVEECIALGGKALKVVFASPDSFGDRKARVANWQGFTSLDFDAFNPSQESIELTLTIKHRGSRDYQTRIELPVVLRPGKSSVRNPIDTMVNVNGSAPDLADVGKWYFALLKATAPPFYLSNIWLAKKTQAAMENGGEAVPKIQPVANASKRSAEKAATDGRSAAASESMVGSTRKALLDVAVGQIPNDIGSDRPDNVQMSIEECSALGKKALKVVFAGPDSFGDRKARVANWQGFTSLAFDAFNPTQENIQLHLTIRHRGSRDYQTRIELPVVLRPGKSSVRIPIATLVNVNGSAPDLADVGKWYLALLEAKAPPFYLGTIWLAKDRALPAVESEATPASTKTPAAPAQRYHVRGTIGQIPVDLIVTPEENPPQAATAVIAPTVPVAPAAAVPSAVSVQPAAKPGPAGDPARLARIRAAKMPPITKPVMFDTPEADAILSALEVFPPDNPWNQVVTDWPVHPNSTNLIASIGPQKPLRCNTDMGFILVPPEQKRIDVKVSPYASESDKGPYPVPDQMPIEGWPAVYRRSLSVREKTLEDLQRDRFNLGGDRHAIVVDPINRTLYEFYQAKKNDAGWEATQASIFDLTTNRLRPEGWTSTDAAGLPIFPAVVRYDELRRGIVEHAMRVTVTKTRQAYIAPATHFASRLVDENLPRMGERLRLRQDFDISGFSPEAQAILKGLKKYGMFVADNGIDWAISVAPDERIPNLHRELRRITGSAFEVVQPPAN